MYNVTISKRLMLAGPQILNLVFYFVEKKVKLLKSGTYLSATHQPHSHPTTSYTHLPLHHPRPLTLTSSICRPYRATLLASRPRLRREYFMVHSVEKLDYTQTHEYTTMNTHTHLHTYTIKTLMSRDSFTEGQRRI